jgi:phenylalanyl-tRNA synthetase beta chain
MKFTLDWLKSISTRRRLAAIADKLTMIGLEVEKIEDKAKAARALTDRTGDRGQAASERRPSARVHGRYRRRQADQVVCGAPNARTGMIGVFVAAGHLHPGKNITLGIGTIRGVESRGMLVSEPRLISDDHDGIIELPATRRRRSYAKYAGLTSRDRDQPHAQPADCTGVHGIARDLARDRYRQVQGEHAEAGEGHFPCPVR